MSDPDDLTPEERVELDRCVSVFKVLWGGSHAAGEAMLRDLLELGFRVGKRQA